MRASAAIWPIVIAWGQGQHPDTQQMKHLQNWLQSSGQVDVWRIVPHQLEVALVARASLLQSFVSRLTQHGLTLPIAQDWTDWVKPLWMLWLPLALRIDGNQRALNQPYVQGILGGQGTGKSTLCQILQLLLGCLGQRAVSLSIDDLYLTYAERCELRRKVPELIWRGPPGTHDIDLGLDVLEQVQRNEATIALPQFDKSLHAGQGDRISPAIVESPTIVLFEGWFVGAQPLSAETLNAADFSFPPPIETPADRQFARDCNSRLSDYLPLWAILHDLIVLLPKDYRWSLQWRQAAEYKMMSEGKTGLSAAEISAFVLYFWKALHPELFITPLTLCPQPSDQANGCLHEQVLSDTAPSNKNPGLETSLVVRIDLSHQVDGLYLPRGGHFKAV